MFTDRTAAQIYEQAKQMAISSYLRRGFVPSRLSEIVKLAGLLNTLQKDAKDRPRIPAGCPDGGEWCPGGGDKHPNAGNSDEKKRKPAKQYSISKKGVDFIAKHEKFEPRTYPDAAGHPTIGFGHKLLPGESFPDGITRDQAQQLLEHDLSTAENIVRNSVTVDITQSQFDALTSLAYNIGGNSFNNSSLLQSLNEGNYAAAADHFLDWNKIRDPQTQHLLPNNGLTNRRNEERNMFLRGIYL